MKPLFFLALFAAPLYALDPLLVSAAISLKEPLEEAALAYAKEAPQVKISFNYGGSGTLQLQIEQGAPVDLFISASLDQASALEKKALLWKSPILLFKNRLVLISPSSKKLPSGSPQAVLQLPQVRRIALGDPRIVPAGMYAKQALEAEGLFRKLEAKYVYAKDVREVLSWVQGGNAELGFVYVTDALTSPQVKILAELPSSGHSPIIYPGTVIKKSRQKEAAQKFLIFLQGENAGEIFKKYGFSPYAP